MLFWRVFIVNNILDLKELMAFTKNVHYCIPLNFSASSSMKHTTSKIEHVTPQKQPLHSKLDENSVSQEHHFKIEYFSPNPPPFTVLIFKIGELFSLLRFLEADPFSYYFCKKCECKELHWSFSDRRTCDSCGHRPMDHTCWFNTELLKPIQRFGAEGEGLIAFRKMYKLLKRLMLRRTKVERADDLGLPSRIVTIRRDLFNEVRPLPSTLGC